MKGIVVELYGKKAVILTDDGLFEEVRNQNYEIGQTIDSKKINGAFSKLAAGITSVAAAIALCTIGTYAYYTPTDYVSLDVNPSVIYTVNRFERILNVEASNDEGEEILSELRLKNKPIDAGIEETLEQLLSEGFLVDEPDNGVVISTSNAKMDEAEQMAARLEDEIRTFLKDKEGTTAMVKAEAVKPEQVAEAKGLGVSPGKLNLVQKLQSSTSAAINQEEWLYKPVKDINKALKENRKAALKEERDTRGKSPAEQQGKDPKKDIEDSERNHDPEAKGNGSKINDKSNNANSNNGKSNNSNSLDEKDRNEYGDKVKETSNHKNGNNKGGMNQNGQNRTNDDDDKDSRKKKDSSNDTIYNDKDWKNDENRSDDIDLTKEKDSKKSDNDKDKRQ